MKKVSTARRACIALIALALVAGLMAPIALQADGISVTIDGAQVTFADQTPVIVDGRTLVPVGGVFSALGFTPEWNGDAQTATLTRDDFTVVITIGSADFTTNGVVFTLDVPAQIIAGRTMLPLRAVLESIGIPAENISWDGATYSVAVTGEAPAEPTPPVAEEPTPVEEPPVEEPPATGGAHANNPDLVGAWEWILVPGFPGVEHYTFHADGTGTFTGGSPIMWWTNNGILYVCITPGMCHTPSACLAPMTYTYSVSGNTLVINSTTISVEYTLTRVQ